MGKYASLGKFFTIHDLLPFFMYNIYSKCEEVTSRTWESIFTSIARRCDAR